MATPGVLRFEHSTPSVDDVKALRQHQLSVEAKITEFTFHDVRHTAATYLARVGASEQQLKAIGGWKSGVVSRYLHLVAEDAQEALQPNIGTNLSTSA